MKLTPQKEQVKNWLTTVMQQPTNSPVSEFFYFDFKDNEFFSILTVDYFLFEEDWTIANGTSSSYSGSETIILAGRMKRIENNDQSILHISPRGIVDSVKIKSEIEAFFKRHSIDINTAKVWEVGDINGNSSVTMDLTVEENKEIKRKWWEFWK